MNAIVAQRGASWGDISEEETLKVVDKTVISETGKNISVGDIYGKWSSFLQKENKNNNVNSKYNYIEEKE